MNADQQMRDIVEKAGEKWYRRISTGEARFVCSCGIGAVHNDHADEHANPSPTDLNEVERLTAVLVWDYRLSFSKSMITNKYQAKVWFDAYTDDAEMKRVFADTPAEALREALWQAIQEVEK